ncbi:MAG: succinate dehydrogenase assembly factor 2 [Pseudomonadota bacterium]
MSEGLNRLRWRSQRGMLELDHILGLFLDRHLARLSPAELDAYEALLGLEDPVLFDLILDRQPAVDPLQASILVRLREPA